MHMTTMKKMMDMIVLVHRRKSLLGFTVKTLVVHYYTPFPITLGKLPTSRLVTMAWNTFTLVAHTFAVILLPCIRYLMLSISGRKVKRLHIFLDMKGTLELLVLLLSDSHPAGAADTLEPRATRI